MIKLTKNQAPTILQGNAQNWTQNVLEKLRLGERLSSTDDARYRHPEIKSALVQETHGKCAYCESKLKHIHHGDVEHITPKSLAPEKRYDWANLTLACEVCNQNKSNKDPRAEHIIDPYDVDPADHLIFIGAFLFTLGTDHGKNTEILLDLNRVALLERRQLHVERIMGVYELLLRTTLPLETRRAIYKKLLDDYTSPDAEYTGMLRCVVNQMKDKLPAGLFQ